MRNKHANEPNIADILSLLSSLDEDILKSDPGERYSHHRDHRYPCVPCPGSGRG